MFTGIVIEQGTVRRRRDRNGVLQIEIDAPKLARALEKGDSVAVNGVCLTATSTGRRRFSAEVVPETLSRSTFARLQKGDNVNLELPVRPSDRLGGHIVQGHVDGVGQVVRIEDDDGVYRVWINSNDDVLRYLVTKGSVTIDGVSLTVADVGRTTFQVALIPHTLAATTLGQIAVDTRVNIEVDVLAKYVERLMERKT
jgi:riboflavin synthase